MFYGIEVNVVDVSLEIAVVTDSVFPIASLPQSKITIPVALGCRPGSDHAGTEVSFDPSPAAGEICVSLRQREDRMEMVWQNYDRIDRKGALLPRRAKGRSERVDMIDKSR
jgi:hypothetical protein